MLVGMKLGPWSVPTPVYSVVGEKEIRMIEGGGNTFHLLRQTSGQLIPSFLDLPDVFLGLVVAHIC
jgi:hypothetical protein